MANKFLDSVKLSKKQVFKAEQGDFHCCKQDNRTKLIACGTSDGILQIAKFYKENIEVFNKAINTEQVKSINWLTNGVICMSFNSPQMALYDPITDDISFYNPCTADIRYTRTISDFEILSWHRNGLTILTDLRTKNKQLVIEDSQPVTVANIHPAHKNIIYTTTVPGTTLKVWDLRYTKRGKYLFKPHKVSNQHACDLETFNGSLFVVDNSSAIFKISETGDFVSKISNTVSSGGRRNGSLYVDEHHDSLFITSEDGVFNILNGSLNKVIQDKTCIGCTGSQSSLFIYSNKRLTNYQIEPILKYN